MTPCSIYWKQF